MPPLFIAAADPSGDQLAAALIPHLRKLTPDLQIVGLAGPKMRAAGVEAVEAAEGVGGVGIVEVIRSVPRSLRLIDRLDRAVGASGARVVLTVDAPSLLLRLARRAKARGCAALHWVAPQVWAWRPGRVEKIARSVSAVLCLLPFEPAWFAGRVRAVFVGHPAAVRPPPPTAAATQRPRFALCPGSRPAEIAALWPVLRQTARHVRTMRPGSTFVVPSLPGARPTGLDADHVQTFAAMGAVDGAVVASGTATIELAARDVPMVAVYRVHPLTAAIARPLISVDAVSLPNLLAGRQLVPEHIQRLDPAAIARDVVACAGMRGQVPREVVDALSGATALERTADEVCGWLG